jgi:transcriptional regulator with XRE-family HTH domain
MDRSTGGNASAKRIGEQLRRAMQRQGMTEQQLADKTGKSRDHINAVLAGYPNSVKRPTQLDTVDEIAAAIGHRLEITRAS